MQANPTMLGGRDATRIITTNGDAVTVAPARTYAACALILQRHVERKRSRPEFVALTADETRQLIAALTAELESDR